MPVSDVDHSSTASIAPRSTDEVDHLLSKVPHVTVAFWVIKILATTLGETGGDALSMTLKLGYGLSTLIFVAFFAVTLGVQVTAKRYHPFAYWAVVVATTTVGTTTSDYVDRTLGLGYVKSSVLLFCCVLAVLVVWRLVTGKIQFEHIATRDNEIFYWVTAPARGRGLATRAAKLLSGWAFDVLDLARIEITVDPRNDTSQRVALAAGFTREGILRSYQRFKDGRMDAVMFSRLPTDL